MRTLDIRNIRLLLISLSTMAPTMSSYPAESLPDINHALQSVMGRSMLSLFSSKMFWIGNEFFILLFTLIILLTHSIPNSQLQIKKYKDLSYFCKGCRNIFGSVCHRPHTMFKHYTKIHNNGIFLRFTKPSECRMGGWTNSTHLSATPEGCFEVHH